MGVALQTSIRGSDHSGTGIRGDTVFSIDAMANRKADVHAAVSQLSGAINGVSDAHVSMYSTLLQKNVSGYTMRPVHADNVRRKLADRTGAKQAGRLNEVYNSLKSKHGRETDRFLYLVTKVLDDADLCDLLHIREKDPAPEDVEPTTPERVAKPSASASLTPSTKKILDAVEDHPPSARKGTQSGTSFFEVPQWLKQRPYMTGQFMQQQGSSAVVLSGQTLSNRRTEDAGAQGDWSKWPLAVQEMMLLDEVLSAMTGLQGRVIRAHPEKGGSFVVDGDSYKVDRALCELAQRCTPLARHYIQITCFIEQKYTQFESGRCMHALLAAMRELLNEYLTFVAQLETLFRSQELTLQRMWYYVQPAMRTMQALGGLVDDIEAQKHVSGGGLLDILYDRASTRSGDPRVCELNNFLLEQAAKPYLRMLGQWIYRGQIDDKFGEFLVQESQHVKKEGLSEDFNDSYWEQKYTLRARRAPRFLLSSAIRGGNSDTTSSTSGTTSSTTAVAQTAENPRDRELCERILRTGKYLNVVRDCRGARHVRCPFETALEVTQQSRIYTEVVDRAFEYASKELLELLMNDHKLLERLRSLKHYFLTDQGDFLVHFMDAAESELLKPVKDIQSSKLESLLELSLRTSVANADPYKDDVHCQLLPYSLITQLLRILHVSTKPHAAVQPDVSAVSTNIIGLESFTLDYSVRWPLSLVISRRALTKYQLLFRHLFQCKHVETKLCSSWLSHQATKEFNVHDSFARSYSLRQRMLSFLQNFQYYMMFEVLEPNWHTFMQRLQHASTIDEVIRCQNDFLDQCLKECLLTSPRLLKIMSKVMTICVIFSNYIQRFTQSLAGTILNNYDSVDDGGSKKHRVYFQLRQTRLKVSTMHVSRILEDEGFHRAVRKFHDDFNVQLKILLDALRNYADSVGESHMASLCTRLDYNDFYNHYFSGKSETSQ